MKGLPRWWSVPCRKDCKVALTNTKENLFLLFKEHWNVSKPAKLPSEDGRKEDPAKPASTVSQAKDVKTTSLFEEEDEEDLFAITKERWQSWEGSGEAFIQNSPAALSKPAGPRHIASVGSWYCCWGGSRGVWVGRGRAGLFCGWSSSLPPLNWPFHFYACDIKSSSSFFISTSAESFADKKEGGRIVETVRKQSAVSGNTCCKCWS